MSPLARTTGVAGITAGVGLVLLTGVHGVIRSPPFVVTTDTQRYCRQLLERVTELVRMSAAPVPTEVASLSVEGRQLCDEGQVRGGVIRLRRAVMVMTNEVDERGEP